VTPTEACSPLAVFKSATSVQFVPSQVSVTATFVGVVPPNASAEVYGPTPAKLCLAVFKSFTSVQELPFHDSVTAVTAGGGLFPP